MAPLGNFVAGIAVVLAAYAPGRLLRMCLLPGWRGWPAGVVTLAFGLGLISLLDLVLTAVGGYTPTVVTVLTVALALVGAALLASQMASRRPKRLRIPRPSAAPGQLIGLLLVLALLVAGIGAIAPETRYDALWYHLGFPSEWLRTGHLTFFPWQYVSGYPFEIELLYGDAIGLAGPVAAKIVNLAFGVLLIGAVIDLGRRLFSDRAALAGALCLVAGPVVIWDASTANIDLAAAMFVVLAVDVAVARVPRADRRSAVACGVLMGFALAAKLTSAYAIPLLALLLLAAPAARARRERVRDGAVAGVLAVLPVVPYLIRSAVLTGDPVFPFFYRAFSTKASLWNAGAEAGLARRQSAYGVGRGPIHLLTLPWDLIAHPFSFGGGFGILIEAGVAVACVLALARRYRPPRVTGLVFAGGLIFGLLWYWPGGTLQTRYAIAAAALLAPFAGAGLEQAVLLARRHGPAPAAAVLAAATAALVLSPLVQDNGYGSLRDALQGVHYVLGGESSYAYLAREIPTYPAELRLGALARPGQRVLVVTNTDLDQVDTRVEHVPCFARDVSGVYESTAAALRDLRRLDVRFVLRERTSDDWCSQVLSAPSFQRRHLEIVYADSRVVLYELRDG